MEDGKYGPEAINPRVLSGGNVENQADSAYNQAA